MEVDMPITSMIVKCREEKASSVAWTIAALPGATVSNVEGDQLVVITETTTREQDQRYKADHCQAARLGNCGGGRSRSGSFAKVGRQDQEVGEGNSPFQVDVAVRVTREILAKVSRQHEEIWEGNIPVSIQVAWKSRN